MSACQVDTDHGWVKVSRRLWPRFWRQEIYESCWYCDAERHHGVITYPKIYKSRYDDI